MAGSKQTIIQGDDATIWFDLEENIGGLSEVTVEFKRASGPPLAVTFTSGKVSIPSTSNPSLVRPILTKAETAQLDVGDSKDVEVHVDFGALRKTFQLQGILSVKKQLL